MRKRSGRPPRFAAVPNETIDDAVQLDFMALALLTVLLRHRDGWDITLARIGAKYGYGEDAMAGAMGLLQVARYVVKVRIMQREGNLWSTEVAVYEVPATDDDVAELLETIREEQPDARRIEVIPPTKTALAKAAKRRAKLGAARVPEFPDSGVSRENTVKPQVVPESGVSRDPGDPGVSKKTITQKTKNTSRPSVRKAEVVRASGSGTEGRTDGGGGVIGDQEREPVWAGGPGGEAAASEGGVTGDAIPAAAGPVELTPGAEVLRAIAAEAPQWTLTGTTLRDQGLAVSGMLLEGFTAQEVRHALLSRPLPTPLTHTVGAVVARRLRDLIAAGPASGVRLIPEQHRADEWASGGYGDRAGSGDVTPTPPSWGARHAQLEAAASGRSVLRNCDGNDGLCDRLAVIGEDQCGRHLGWERCPQCARYRRPGHEVCDRCQDAGSVSGTETHTAPAPF